MKTKTPVLYRDAIYKADGFRDDGEIWEMARKRAYQPTVVSCNEDGFPIEPNQSGFPGVEFCRSTPVRPICAKVAIWRVVKVGLRSISTGYYCDEHVDQKVDFSEMEE